MKYLFRFALSLLLLVVMILPAAQAQHITLQPASGGITGILTAAANDTAISITNGRTIRLKPGVNGIVVGNTVGTQYVFPAARGTTGQQLSLDASGNLVWGTPSSLTGFTNTNNTALGISAGTAISTGTENVFVGSSAGSANTIGKYNTGIGHNALFVNTTAQANTALGYRALYSLSFTNAGTAYFTGNTAIGYQALTSTQPTASNNSGNSNTAVGFNAMRVNTTGYENTAVGHSALDNVTTGYQNVALGENAGGLLTTGNNNTFLGRYAGQKATTSVDNIFIGATSAANVTSSSSNIAIGKYALLSLSFSNAGTAWNAYNIAIGEQALGSLNPTVASNATYNIGIGNSALSSNTSGNRNIAIGAAAGSGVTGSDNILIGYQAAVSLGAISNKLHIGAGTTPLIGGDFTASTVTLNGTLTINTSTNSFSFPNARGTNGQVLTTNGAGTTSWTTISGADNLGNHTATQKLDLGTNKLVGNGGANGLAVNNLGHVTLDGNLSTGGNLTVAGTASILGTSTFSGISIFNSGANSFTMPTTRATAVGQVLTATNTTGGLAWQAPPAADNLGNHTATQKLDLGTNKLVGNAGTTGIGIAASGAVTLDNSLTVSGSTTLGGGTTFNTLTNTFTMPTTRGTNGQVLTTNGAGGTSWGNLAEINNGTSVSRVVATASAIDFYTASTLSWRMTGNRLENQGTSNVIIGNGSGTSASGSTNTMVGNNNGGGASFSSNNNTLLGNTLGNALTTGGNNTFVGSVNGIATTTGFNNIAIGSAALNNNQTGANNVAIGTNSLNGASSGASFSNNTAVGAFSLGDNATGTNNTALGSEAGTNTTTGSQNTYLGTQAGFTGTTAGSNVAVGYQAGYSSVGGTGNVFLGNQAGYNETGSNKLYIDNNSTATPLIWGDFSANRVWVNGSLKVENSGTIGGIAISQTVGSLYGTGLTWSFPTAFPAGVVPHIIVVPKYVSGSARVIITIKNVTNTGFEFEAMTVANSGGPTASTYDFQWIAFE